MNQTQPPKAPVANRSRGRWTSFIADADMDAGAPAVRMLHEIGKPEHRLRVEHNNATLLIHLSGEDGSGWTVLAVDRETRRWAVVQDVRQLDAAQRAYRELYPPEPAGNDGTR
jgi:hypothetical protein